MDFLRQIQHLLPRGKAWSITASKNLRNFFAGLSGLGEDAKEFTDLAWLDIFPDTTRDLASWEAQFGLKSDGLTVAERRQRLTAAWQAVGGQSPRYLQDALQAAGFDVYVHEWWDPADEPPVGIGTRPVDPRNPREYLLYEREEIAAGPIPPGGDPPTVTVINETAGYVLVNPIYSTRTVILPRAGVAGATAGSSISTAGRFRSYVDEPLEYPIPVDPAFWPYFLYIGGETFPDLAYLPPERQSEFEELCLKLCPAHLWLGLLVGYNPNGQGSGPINLATAIYESLDFVEAGSGAINLALATYESLDFVESGSGSIDLSTATYEVGSS